MACDIPATRKTCGFKNHNANYGCSKCFKFFKGGFGEKDFSGFNRSQWPKRTKAKHNKDSAKLLKCVTKKQYEELSKKTGIHYSVLTRLKYFDAVRFHIIDPMHNLFLGITKKTWKVWMEKVLSKKQLAEINKKISEVNVATDVGRIGSNIVSNYGTYTAQEWKNWTTIHSMHVLRGILPNDQLEVWEMFILASRILCQPVLTHDEVRRADVLLLEFCKGFSRIYGNDVVTPNMHLSCHLIDSLLDYGPVYGFWLFSFERYNGELGAFVTNNRCVEIQYMRNFITGIFVNPENGNVPSLYKDEFEDLFWKGKIEQHSSPQNVLSLYLTSSAQCAESVVWSDVTYITLPSEFVEDALDDDDVKSLTDVYAAIYPHLPSVTRDGFPRLVKRYKYLCIGQEKYGSRADSHSNRSARVLARWVTNSGEVSLQEETLRPGLVVNYISHSILLNGTLTPHLFAIVRWYKKAPSLSNLNQLWFDAQFENGGASAFLPAQRINCRFSAGFVKTPCHRYFEVCPLPRMIVS